MSFADRKFHLIGIGGAGMSGLAVAAVQLGAKVSGSDRSQSTYTDRLVALGLEVKIGHDASALPMDAEVVVSTAIGDENPELAAARAAGMKIMHRADLLSELVSTKPKCIAIAGTHGKTTTTAMVAHVLTKLGEDPSFFVGGEVSVGGEVTNARIGGGDVVVVEADESDGSFLKLAPTVAVVTNVELDHHATWSGGIEELFAAFGKFVAPARTAVVWGGQPRLRELRPESSAADVIGFEIGVDSALAGDLVATEVVTPIDDVTSGSSFRLPDLEGPIELGVRGDHNVLNALAALAALRAVGISVDRAAPALKSFTGVGRRFELLGTTSDGVHVYDDYAHHPTEVRAALKTARETTAGGRVVAVFQPHLYSRTQSLAHDFGRALAAADIVVVTDIYEARELAADFPGVSGWLIATETADANPGVTVHWTPGFDDAQTTLSRILRPGDLCITIGAGDVFRVSHELLGGVE